MSHRKFQNILVSLAMFLAEDFITAHTAPDDVRATMNFKVNSNEFNEKFLSHRPLSSVQKPQLNLNFHTYSCQKNRCSTDYHFPLRDLLIKTFLPKSLAKKRAKSFNFIHSHSRRIMFSGVAVRRASAWKIPPFDAVLTCVLQAR